MCSWIINSVLILFLHFNPFNTLGLTETIDEIVIELSDGDDTGAVSERFHNLEFVDKLSIGERTFYKFKLKDNDGGHLPSTSRSAATTIRALQTDSSIGYVGPQIRRHFYKKTLDEGWEKQWHLNGQIYPSMNVHKAWEAGYTGNDVVIAIVDDGIQTNHPDLRNNVDTVNDYDYISSDSNPFPTFSSDSHGTQIAGLIAAERDNGVCVVGVAYNASLVGVRLIGDFAVTDFEQAQALSHYKSDVDIYTCSWGPEELTDFESMDFLTSLTIAHNAKKGRSGKGIIYTWSAGNGGTNDNCNADGFTNSIYTIGVTALGIGKEADYAEVCAASLATVYGGITDSYLMTTSTLSRCSDDGIEGTSYSTPIVAGIIALALQANRDLTWRDVQHLIVYSSSRTNLTDTYDGWQTNGAGKEVSQVLSFGILDADKMVTLANNWTQVPAQETCKLPKQFNTKGTKGSAFSTVSLEFHNKEDCNINFLEHVTVDVEFSYSRYRGDTEIYLKSSSGTTSHILTYRPFDSYVYSDRGDLSWTYMSVHYWGEDPNGTWELLFRSCHGFSTVIVKEWSITLYGTKTDPYLGDNQLLTDNQRINQNDGSNDTYIILGAVLGLSTLLAFGIILLKKKSVSTIVPSKSISKESTCKIISHTKSTVVPQL